MATTRFSSSKPDERRNLPRRSSTMLTQLATMASVNATSRVMSRNRARLWMRARKTGPNSMACTSLLLRLQMRGGRDAADAPRRIKPGDQAGAEGQQDGGADHRQLELEQARLVGRANEPVDAVQQRQRGEQADDAAEQRHQLALEQVLQEDVAAAGAQRTPHPHLRRPGEELAEQDADQVHRRDDEEEQADDQHRLRRARHHLHPVEEGGHVVEPVVERALEAAELLLLADVAVDPALVGLLLLGVVELHPVLDPDRFRLQLVLVLAPPRLPAAGVAGGGDLHLRRPAEGDVDLLGPL